MASPRYLLSLEEALIFLSSTLRLLLWLLWTLPSTLTSSRSVIEPIRLSKSVTELRPAYDVVVIGSGYGGGIAASRMARAEPKQSVCVLELGEERWPGNFPRSLLSVLSQLRISGLLSLSARRSIAVNFGKATALYHWVLGLGSNAFVGHGEMEVVVHRLDRQLTTSRRTWRNEPD